eukprot:TRINITY_DN6624_c0_g1_i5.p1 TRINITY_DN6624_c0_g1~~TRINITY_DN6624_c0_g1_i5.p1  ORF type:complete len:159 (-),score=38.65 TRINITY_DN6624_c0_g1_i5:33-509(-)
MTRYRPEVIILGLHSDGSTWKEYQFHYKPGRLNRAPPFLPPGHFLRLDWMLWFCGLRPDEPEPWTEILALRLLQGAKQTLSLLSVNPFPDKPPVAIKMSIWNYTFTTIEERRETGNWWKREYLGNYGKGVYTLENLPKKIHVIPKKKKKKKKKKSTLR